MRKLKSLRALALCLPALAPAQAPSDGERVEIRAHYDNAVGSSDAASQGVI
ncbi:MAG: hypothetical protein QM750_11450 [Rubrivivax sp.]